MLKRFTVALLSGGVILAGCSDAPDTTAPEVPAAFEIVDGSTAGTEASLATQNTFFLPPVVTPDPVESGEATGDFDPTHSPVFRIVELDDLDLQCGGQIAEFTMTSGPGSETIRLETEDEHYIADWHTNEFDLSSDCTYRILVLVSDLEVAHADVQVAETGSELRSIDTGESVALKDGKTLPIKVRIQEFCAEGTVCSAGFIDPSEGGTVSLFDPETGNLAAEFDCGVTCADQPFVLSLTLLDNDANPSPDLEGDNQFPYFVNAETLPEGVLFDGNNTFTVCQTVAFQEEREQQNLGDESLRLFRVDDGVTDIREDSENNFEEDCAAPGEEIGSSSAPASGVWSLAPVRKVVGAMERVAQLLGPRALEASFLLHGGLNTTLEDETFSDWGATDVGQIDVEVIVNGIIEPEPIEGVDVSVDAPEPDFDTSGTTGTEGSVLFEHLPIFEGDPLIELPPPAYTVTIDTDDLPEGVSCETTSQDVALDVAGETEEVTFECSEDGTGTIEVTVLGESEQPLEGAEVDIINGIVVPKVTTNESGVAVFEDVPLGSYDASTTFIGAECTNETVTLATDGETVSTTLLCPVFEAAGIADVDGELGSGEWDPAICHSFDANLPGGGTTPAEFCVMNDDTDVYFRLLVDRSPDPQSLFFVEFDADADQTVGLDPGDDMVLTQQPPAGGFFRDETILQGPATTDDTQLQGGELNGAGAHSFLTGQSLFEMSHPLSSNDAHDISVAAGDAIQFQVGISLTDPNTETSAVTRVPSGTGAGTTGFVLQIAQSLF